MDIFEEKQFYPKDGVPIKEHYREYFDAVFLAFVPFFRLENDFGKSSFQRLHRITYPEFQKAHPDLKIPESAGDFYSNENPEYPTDEQILKFGSPVKWSEVKSTAGFADYAEINKALRSTIGGYRAVFSRDDLADRLLTFANQNQVFLPTEGQFDALSKASILKAFRKLNKTSIVIEDEYQEKKVTLDITDISSEKFSEKIQLKDYYIYDTDRELLFAIDWDFCFFLICSNQKKLAEILTDQEFEGFYCDETTELPWETTPEDLRVGLEHEALDAKSRNELEGSKPWWKIWR